MVETNISRLIMKGAACALLCFWCSGLLAQESDNPYKGLPFKDRIFFGGDFGLSFGTFTYVRVAPILGYRVSENFAVGGGPNYQYIRIRYDLAGGGRQDTQTHIFGLNTFARLFVFDPVFIQTDFEILNLRGSIRDPNNFFDREVQRVTVPVWLVGAGYGQRSGNGGIMVGVFYDLIGDRNSPYGREFIIRAGFFF